MTADFTPTLTPAALQMTDEEFRRRGVPVPTDRERKDGQYQQPRSPQPVEPPSGFAAIPTWARGQDDGGDRIRAVLERQGSITIGIDVGSGPDQTVILTPSQLAAAIGESLTPQPSIASDNRALPDQSRMLIAAQRAALRANTDIPYMTADDYAEVDHRSLTLEQIAVIEAGQELTEQHLHPTLAQGASTENPEAESVQSALPVNTGRPRASSARKPGRPRKAKR